MTFFNLYKRKISSQCIEEIYTYSETAYKASRDSFTEIDKSITNGSILCSVVDK